MYRTDRGNVPAYLTAKFLLSFNASETTQRAIYTMHSVNIIPVL